KSEGRHMAGPQGCYVLVLEAETEAEFSAEGTRDVGVAGIDEPEVLAESSGSRQIIQVAVKVVSKVGVVGQVVEIGHQIEPWSFTQLDGLGDAGIKLEEWRTTLRIEAQHMAGSGCQTCIDLASQCCCREGLRGRRIDSVTKLVEE